MKRGNTKVKNEKYWSKLVIGAICMMAVATVPTRVNAETLPEEKDTIECRQLATGEYPKVL